METKEILVRIGKLQTLSSNIYKLENKQAAAWDTLRDNFFYFLSEKFKETDLEKTDFIIPGDERFTLLDLIGDRLADATSFKAFRVIAFPPDLAQRFIHIIQENFPFVLKEHITDKKKKKVLADAKYFAAGLFNEDYSIYEECYKRGYKFYKIKLVK